MQVAKQADCKSEAFGFHRFESCLAYHSGRLAQRVEAPDLESGCSRFDSWVGYQNRPRPRGQIGKVAGLKIRNVRVRISPGTPEA